jgi:transcriptional regulator with XRE-family HTH domain
MKEPVKQKEYDLRSAHAKERRRPTLASANSRAGAQASADAEALARGHSQVETQRATSRSGGRAGRGLLMHAVHAVPGGKGSDPGAAGWAAAESGAAEGHDSGSPAEPNAGMLLRRAREARGLTVSDIAKKTRIADRWIVAIEEVQIEQLPAPVFAIGYVRNYARAVGLDPSEFVERFRQFGQQRDDSFWGSLHDRSGPTPRSLEQAAAQRRYMLWTAALLLLGLAALVAVWLRSRR